MLSSKSQLPHSSLLVAMAISDIHMLYMCHVSHAHVLHVLIGQRMCTFTRSVVVDIIHCTDYLHGLHTRQHGEMCVCEHGTDWKVWPQSARTEYVTLQGRIQDFRKGGSFIWRAAAEGSAQRRVVLINPRKAWKKIFSFFSQLSGWALVAPSCFTLQFQMWNECRTRGRQMLPFLAQISLTQHNTYFRIKLY